MQRILLLFFTGFFLIPAAFSQDTIKPVRVPGMIIEGDTLPFIDVNAVVIFPPVDVTHRKELLRYDRLVYNVRKVYTYAKMAGEKLGQYKQELEKMEDEKARKRYIRQAEKELEAQFGDEIRDLTFSQGKILIKLIYRETGNSSYDIVKELRGGLTAFIWQTMAKLFGYDLKTGYDPSGEDQAIERIILMIEAGEI